MMQKSPLWTRNFSILTLGSAVSMLGNSVSAFAIGLFMLDKTGSVFLYTLFLASYNLPKIILPIIAGSYLDRRSRRKTVFTLDFISSAVFLLMFLIARGGFFHYGMYLALCLIIGSIDSMYAVAYDSFFPMLVSEGNFSKAYSVSSLLYPLAYMMTPVAAWAYKSFGLAPLFMFNACSFFMAAVCETQIKLTEPQLTTKITRFSFREFKSDMKSGFSYIRQEKGLLIITAYFFVNTLCSFGVDALWLPHFKSVAALGVMAYSYISAVNVLGSLIGSAAQYRINYPAKKKFAIAMFVYVIISILDGGVLFTPLWAMLIIFFIDGMLSVTSYNIRLSTVQSYVPEEYRGRFNGCFQMVSNLGLIIGELSAGALAELFPSRSIIIGFMAVNVIGAFALMYRGRSHVKLVFNRDV